MANKNDAMSMHSNCHDHKEDLQDVLIIGGGIAGLATALALHRMGIKPMVLERSDKLETSGSSITLWTNAWKALEALGVADGLREKFGRISGIESRTLSGELQSSIKFPRDTEMRGLMRMVLLEALSDPLPKNVIHYGVEIIGIKKNDIGHTEVECKNGWKIQTKALIGCDGVGSVVAKWMGLKDAKHAGHTAIRGLTTFPDDHKSNALATEMLIRQFTGPGVRAGVLHISSNTWYWFVVFNTKGPRIYEPELILKEALAYVQGCSDPIMAEAIRHTQLESLSRRDIVDRWTWPGVISGPALSQGGVTLAGDALHPMTPHLGQGGCCALEDAVVLGRHLGHALRMSKQQDLHARCEMDVIENALKEYTQERWPRTLVITIKAYMIGALMQSENRILCSIKGALLPRLQRLSGNHTLYDCGKLQ